MNGSYRASPSACQFGSWQHFQQRFLQIWGPSLRTCASGDVKSTFRWGGGGRGTPHHSSTHGTGRGRSGKVRQDHKRNVAELAMPLQTFSTSQSRKSAVNEKLEMSHAHMFFFKKKTNPPVSLLCLPRGSSNSSPWPSLLNFPLYNLLNSRISTVTTACYG